VKKLLFAIILSIHCSLFYGDIPQGLEKQFLNNNSTWEKTKEEVHYQEFHSIKNPEETLSITCYPLKTQPYHDSVLERRHDLFSLFEKQPLSALTEMKRLRLESKKESSPYSVWKLLYVFHQDDIIYESIVPEIGPYPPYYEITRLIKQEEGYLKITYHSNSKNIYEDWLKQFQTLEISPMSN